MKKRQVGRPYLPKLDLKEMGRLVMESNASDRELGLVFGVDHKTIENNYSPFVAKKRAERRLAIKSWQTEKARRGDTTMQIWLGKVECDQEDKQSVNHTGEVSAIVKFIMPRPGDKVECQKK